MNSLFKGALTLTACLVLSAPAFASPPPAGYLPAQDPAEDTASTPESDRADLMHMLGELVERALDIPGLDGAWDGADEPTELHPVFAFEYPPREHYLESCLYENPDALPDVPVVVNNSVEWFIRYFQNSNREHFEVWLARTSRYMDMIHQILREEDVPEDLFYIAMIESGLNPRARSRSNAVGMWQFIRATAVRYGLRVDWWIDERRDPEKATRAAARYFKSLYGRFGSWYLAAAGYNAGEGRVARAVRRHNSTDFWKLARYRWPLRRETRNYVPKYLAAMLIAKDPGKYGFDVSYHDPVDYDKVNVPQATDLRVIARAAGTTVSELRRLNPELLRWFTPPNHPDYQIKLPAGTAERYMENIEKVPSDERVKFLRHRVRRGDTLYTIARRYGAPLKHIIYLNDIKRPRLIRPGMVIMVPVRADDDVASNAPEHGPQG